MLHWADAAQQLLLGYGLLLVTYILQLVQAQLQAFIWCISLATASQVFSSEGRP